MKKKGEKKKEKKKEFAQFTKTPLKQTKAEYAGVPVYRMSIKPVDKNTTIDDAHGFIKATMNNLFSQYKPTKDSQKMFKITYKLSDDKWYSSKFFSSANEDYYPDVESIYGRDISKETIEHMNINVITLNPLIHTATSKRTRKKK